LATLTPAAVRKQIEAGTAEPIYLILGEDEVEKSGLADPDTMNGVAALELRYKLTSDRQAYTLL
jgi:hypothetical protein